MITTAPAPADAGLPADSPLAGAPGLVAWYAEGFSDVLGDRLRLFDNAGPALELLRFHASVASRPGFEAAVRARVDALAKFSHPPFARVRALKLLDDPSPQLALVSELVAGERLSTVLRAAEARGVRLDTTCCHLAAAPALAGSGVIARRHGRGPASPAGRRSYRADVGRRDRHHRVRLRWIAGGHAADSPHDRCGTSGDARDSHPDRTAASSRRAEAQFRAADQAGLRDVPLRRCSASVADARADLGGRSVSIGARGLSRPKRTAAGCLG